MSLVVLLLVPAIVVGAAADRPAPTDRDLDLLAARLANPLAADRIAAAQQMASLPATGFDLYVDRLKRPRSAKPEVWRTLILEAWGQVPNPNYQKDGNLWLRKPEPRPPRLPRNAKAGEPRPKRAPPHDPEKTDWISALGELTVEGPDMSKALAAIPDGIAARAEAMEIVALLRAIAATRRTDAIDPLFDFAFAADGVFRDECGRAIRSMESHAIPGLILRMRAPARSPQDGIGGFRRRRYASYQLDRMDRARPENAVRSAPDDHVRAEILHAYGEVRAIDAVDAVLQQVDSTSRQVRNEARWAWLRYVHGPPPPEPPKRHRKLPGGHEESVEKEDYLSYRELALLALVRKLAAIHGDPDCARCPKDKDRQLRIPVKADAEAMTREVFEHHDKIRDAAWNAEFDAAMAKAKARDIDGALSGFSWILAHDPMYGRRGEVADIYFARGEELLRGGDEERGEALLHQAIVLDPGSARARKMDARLRVRAGERRQSEGIEAIDDFHQALELDPDNVEAKRAIAELEAGKGRPPRVRETMVAAGGLAIVLLALALWRLLYTGRIAREQKG